MCLTNWDKLSKAGLFRFLFCVPLSSEVRMRLSSEYREGTSHIRVCDLLQGKVRGFFLHMPFLKFLQLKLVTVLRCHILV